MLDTGLELAMRRPCLTLPPPPPAPPPPLTSLSFSRSAVSALGVDTTGSRGVHPLFEKKLNQFVKRKKLSPPSRSTPLPPFSGLHPDSPSLLFSARPRLMRTEKRFRARARARAPRHWNSMSSRRKSRHCNFNRKEN